jgi:host factor-I protein
MPRDIKAGMVGEVGRVPKANKGRPGNAAPSKRSQGENCQDRMLDEWRRLATELDVYLRNGTRIRGVLKGFDAFVLALETEEGLRVVYKQVVLTMGPAGARSHDEPAGKRPVLTLKRRGPSA